MLAVLRVGATGSFFGWAVSLLVGVALAQGNEPAEQAPDQKAASSPTLHGTLVDEDGRPIANARVDIAWAAPRKGPSLFCPSCYRDCAKWARTGDDGRFTLENLDAALKFCLLCTLPGKQSLVTELLDPNEGPVKLALEDLPQDVPPERIVRGRIISDLGVPIEGALVTPVGGKTASRQWGGQVKDVRPAVSDARGDFQMQLPADFLGVDLQVMADGHAGTKVTLIEPGGEPKEIVVPIGTTVSGRVFHRGQPYPGLRIAVVQLNRSSDDHFIRAVEAITNNDGRFSFSHLPANQPYVIFSIVAGRDRNIVLSTKKFNAYDSRKERDLGTLELSEGLRLSGKLILPAGASLPANARLTLGRDPAWDLISVEVNQDGSFEIASLPPETYEVRIAADGLDLDTSRLNYQPLNKNSFGIHLSQSKHDLQIPLTAAAAKN